MPLRQSVIVALRLYTLIGCRSPVTIANRKVPGSNAAVTGKLEAANQYIEYAVGIAKQFLSAANRQINNAVEVNVVEWNSGTLWTEKNWTIETRKNTFAWTKTREADPRPSV